MKISKQGIELIKHFESYEMKAYKCPADVWTIGWGFTRVNGVKIKKGDIMTLKVADLELIKQLKIYENVVKKVIMIKKINQNQYDALVSLCYNIGGSSFRKSDIVQLVNGRNFIGACKIFNLWSKAAGKRSKGLLRRRMSERNLFCSWPSPIVKVVPQNYEIAYKEI
ncbi:lysozyme [Psychrilyobacter atlanticus]|uniref:lysozyme n=1 Tax=Psychrilyobacter atlanticus TaxID=271091 RepID=UPI000426EE91|nr:lysozyme [Psychrilyobacter atlanticus]